MKFILLLTLISARPDITAIDTDSLTKQERKEHAIWVIDELMTSATEAGFGVDLQLLREALVGDKRIDPYTF